MSRKQKGFSRIELAVVIATALILVIVVMVSLGLARQDARDAQRLSDIRQIMTALKLFRNDNGRYPASLGARPVGGNPAFETYIIWPAAPRPTDGSCIAAQNTYVYAPAGSPPNSYTLTFCLGSTTDGVPAGPRTATPLGIK